MKHARLLAVSVIFVIAVLGGCLSISGDPPEWGSDVPRGGAESVNTIERLYWEDAAAIKIPVSNDLVELGRATYNTRCLICHGKEGKGDGLASNYLGTKPRDFTQAVFKYRSTPQTSFPRDEDLFRSISVGFPIYGMPSFHYLSDRQRWGLVYYVKKLTKNGFREFLLEDEEDPDLDEIDEILAEKLTSGKPFDVGVAPEWTDRAVAEGKDVYEALACAKCHGETGMGDGPSALDQQDIWGNDLSPVPFALNGYFMKAGGRPRDIVRVLMTGVGGTGMPRYETESQDDYWKLAYYILQLSRERSEKDK